MMGGFFVRSAPSTRCLLVALAAILSVPFSVPASAQEKSVKPGINKGDEKADAQRRATQYERASRDVVQKLDAIVAACRLKPGMSVADVGAGSGLFTRPLARKVAPGGKVYAVEIAKKFVDHIEKTCREQGIDNVTGVLGTPVSAELPAESVDVVFTCDTYHHFEYPYKMLASIHRALRPGGRLVIVDYKKEEGVSPKWVFGHVRADMKLVVKEVTEAGFKLIDTDRKLLKIQYVARFEKVE